MSCCNHDQPDPNTPVLQIFTRTVVVEAFPVDSAFDTGFKAVGVPTLNYMVRTVPSYPTTPAIEGDIPTHDWMLIPADTFLTHFKPVTYMEIPDMPETTSMGDSLNTELVADLLKVPFVDDVFASAGADENNLNEVAFGLGNNIIQNIISRIPDATHRFRNFITIDMLLAGARLAFDFAIGKIPFPVPKFITDQLWNTLETAIRSIWAADPISAEPA